MTLFDFQTPGAITDHRAARVPLWSYKAVSGEDGGEYERDLSARIAFLSLQHTRRIFMLFGALAPAVLLALTCAGVRIEIAAALLMGAVFGTALLLRRSLHQITGPLIRDALLSEARCASCAVVAAPAPPSATAGL